MVSTGAESAPSCSREGSTSDKPLLEPEPVVEVDTLEDDLPEDIDRDADPLPDSGCNSASDDELPGSVPHDLTEEEIFASAFAKLSTEKLPHLGTSKAGATAMVMSFAVAQGLTWAPLGDLATLGNAIAGTEVLPRSKYMFCQLWSIKKDGLVEYWYLCDDCGAVLTVTGGNAVCKICNTEELLIVNELPPDVRFQHPTLAGLWFGRDHPDMQAFLARFVGQINDMEAVVWDDGMALHRSKVDALCCSVDAPARASVLNMIRFNGLSGCPWCLILAKHEQEYLIKHIRNAYLRYLVLLNFLAPRGPTALMNLHGFDLVAGISVDYMHCVLLGVCRQVTDAWFNSKNSDLPFYAGKRPQRDKVNERLLCIQPPHCITRFPRRVEDRIHWKASEWKQWLLYYAIACTEGVVPLEQWLHFMKLSEAVHILLRKSLSARAIDRADNFLHTVKYLYGATGATFNVHQLLHLASSVRNLGPLWANSAFVFESGNGKIVKSVTAANGLPHQIVERVAMAQQLDLCVATLNITGEEREICETFLGHTHVSNAVQIEDVTLLGLNRHADLSDTEKQLLHEVGYGSADCYDRFMWKKQVYHSMLYKRPSKSDTTFVETTEGFFPDTKSCQHSSQGRP
ncbi:hypothetical protein HPB48_025227 [Haemaphysalis longicornis]|uniref:Cr1-8 nvi n=1 Tax=Haemaphysalis longicornis TaxID=44386 RepID=A0A9J6H7F7_HAELO|nr:hypothetical protein HPB48_025227 [Haemaphysalis longicornis]